MYSVRMRASEGGIHVSGAETLCDAHEVQSEAEAMFRRAAARGAQAVNLTIAVTVERLDEAPVEMPCLRVCTLDVPDSVAHNGNNTSEARVGPSRAAAEEILRLVGVGPAAIARAWRIIDNIETPGGAALIDMNDAQRLDDFAAGGLRVTRFAYTKAARAEVDKALRDAGLTHFRTREALALASKAAACTGIEAELCVSDDPAYTTGYVASGSAGYVRVPAIKAEGSRRGGRVYFVAGGADVCGIVLYLTRTPVLISYVPIFPIGKSRIVPDAPAP